MSSPVGNGLMLQQIYIKSMTKPMSTEFRVARSWVNGIQIRPNVG